MSLSLPLRTLTSAAAALALGLGCAGLFADRVDLPAPVADRCGGITVTPIVDVARRERVMRVYVNDALAGEATVPAGAPAPPTRVRARAAEEARVAVEVGRTRTEDRLVLVPPWDAVVTAAPPAPLRSMVPGTVTARVLSPCEDLGAVAVNVRLEPGSIAVLQGEAVPRSREIAVPVPPLPTGAYTLEVWLRDGDRRVHGHDLSIEVGPPCVDADGDGVMACDGDCDDTDPNVRPGAKEVLGNNVDDDCDGLNGRDADGDGHEAASSGGDDCDDDDPAVPKTEEDPLPNGKDDDCDGKVDEGTTAYDDDGDGLSEDQGDCDDADPKKSPRASEIGDCRDNDCDGTVDEGVERPYTDDAYEPNDATPHRLEGAQQMRPILGFPGGYKPTGDRLLLVTRNERDVEKFVVWTHDGKVDTFWVHARIEEIPDDAAYEVTVAGPAGSRTEIVSKAGESVSIGDRPLMDDGGDYTIAIVPREGKLPYCPLVVWIGSN